MAKKLQSLRLLDARDVSYEVVQFPDTIHSAQGVADYCGLLTSQVYKTLVVLPPQGKPLLVMIAADRELHLRRLAQALRVKRLRMATHKEAEALTGLKVGSISALALQHRGFHVYIDHAATTLDTILVSAGQRGIDVRLQVSAFMDITGATCVNATGPEA